MEAPERYGNLGVILEYRSLDPQWLCNDRVHYQRDLDQERVSKARRKAVRASQVLVSVHPDETYWVIDGQHHAEAALRFDFDLIDCWVFQSPGWERDREIFNEFQRGQ